jgi:hypothetical protein
VQRQAELQVRLRAGQAWRLGRQTE